MSEEVLVVDQVSVSAHAERGIVRAVNDVSFVLRRGDMLGLVGESGSGKSMLSRNMMGLHNGDQAIAVSGTVTLGGEEITGVPVRQLRERWGSEISIVLQDPLASLNPVRRIGVQLTETIRRHRRGVTRAAARAAAVGLLQSVGIADPARRFRAYPHELSGGMRQRVMIAVALAGDPDVLIADEPTTALDVTVQAQILELLDAERRTRNLAVVFVTHDLSLVASRSDRVAVMYAGEIVEDAPTASLFASPRMPYTRALLDALPPLSGPTHQQLAAIPGTPPDPTEPMVGCRFRARCPIASELCASSRPALAEIAPGHRVRCHFPLPPAVPGTAAEQVAGHGTAEGGRHDG